ncbi:MAG TPA: hypothetical protein VGJ59_03510 [Jatrophihabitantaceae bacterium]|jgi:hypothetical protein
MPYGILINAADAAYTGTDFNNHRGTQTVTEHTDAIVHLATLPPDQTGPPAPSKTGTAPFSARSRPTAA